ncbi:acid protease [Aspergillus heteromorphus CBS 117.55]|uniref:Acid protease n=1 Tax=Aspergillus heteromorphus CBS 117.55 TaxID=1448321 RepID=A0A317WMD0_9EURO|nr:acid protease [Aspergillus heteromorphus CBS 117.55]PWY86207.1 acid protease [Aspergillus heteromorphus CBS 117.55]
MHLSQRLFTAACLCASATAFIPYTIKLDAPVEKSAGHGAFTRRFLPLSKPSDALAASSSSDESLTLDIKRVPARRDNDFSIVLAETPTWKNTAALDQDGDDISYFSVVNIGSEEQALYMMLDTGGSDTWVFSSNCTAKSCTMHNQLNSSSSTLDMTTEEWSVGYGTGTVSGVLGTDNLTIGGVDVRMTFGLASNASDNFESYPMDGILGMGRTNESSYSNPTFMDAVATLNLFKSNIVGFALSRSPEKDGTVTFGSADQDKYTGDITYTDTVTGSGSYWRIPVDDASVDGTSCDFSNKSAIIDTGTSYAMLPSSDAKALHALIPGSSSSGDYFIIPCNTTANVQVTFSGVNYTISYKDYVGETYGSGCVSNIVSYDLFGDDIWLLGDVFLKNVYAVFDYDEERVGFAERSTSSSNSTDTSSSNGTTSASGSTGTASSTSSKGSASSTSSSKSGSAMTINAPEYFLSALVIASCMLWL